jgi:hypothetical protein
MTSMCGGLCLKFAVGRVGEVSPLQTRFTQTLNSNKKVDKCYNMTTFVHRIFRREHLNQKVKTLSAILIFLLQCRNINERQSLP